MPWPVVMIAGFLVPGLGHFLHGERKRGVVIGAGVLGLFVLGVLIGGVRVVSFPDFSLPTNLIGKLLSNVAFIPQFFAGPIALASAGWSAALAGNPETARIASHARLADIGMLYTAVAGGLNLLAMIDVTARAAELAEPRDGAAEEGAGA